MTPDEHKAARNRNMKTDTQPGAAVSAQPSAGAMRAAVQILHAGTSVTASRDALRAAAIIDRETAAPQLLTALRNIADVAGKIVNQNGSAQAAFIRGEALAAIVAATNE